MSSNQQPQWVVLVQLHRRDGAFGWQTIYAGRTEKRHSSNTTGSCGTVAGRTSCS